MKIQSRKKKKKQDHLVLNLLILVALVLVVFEGRLIGTMISHRSVMNDAASTTVISESETGAIANINSDTDTDAAYTEPIISASASGPELSLAGLPDASSRAAAAASANESVKLPTVSNPDSPAIVRETSPAVDDSYFSDAAFIGDSRMQGFRNASGITQGQFFTSVGMSLSKMKSEAIIPTADGENITVAAALSGGVYNKIYIMLGANDLGEYDWDAFRDGFVSVIRRFKEIQPNALIYICSCIYVEESKVTTSYVNNTNVDTINQILLEICEQEDYHYLDLNEFLSNGYGSLLEGASSDGVHLYENYCKQILNYMKTHYIEVPEQEQETDTETQTEALTEADTASDKT